MKPVYDLAFFRCHQFPHHSIFWQGAQLPICMRDVGITMGFLAGILAIYIAKNHRSKNVDWRALLLLVPMGIDGGLQALGVWESTFLSRYITGMLTGFALAVVFVALLQDKLKERVPSSQGILYFALLSIPLFFGYWSMDLGYPIGIFGDFLFWLVAWSIPFIYFVMALVALIVAWRVFKKATDEMEKSLKKSSN